MPKEKPRVNIGEVIKTYRSQRGLSQGDIERRTGLLRCYLSRVENGHTVPSLETLAKIAEAMDISLADFFPGTETPRDRESQKMLGELSQDEIRFLAEIKRFSTTLSEGDKRLVLAMIRKMASLIPPPVAKKPVDSPSGYGLTTHSSFQFIGRESSEWHREGLNRCVLRAPDCTFSPFEIDGFNIAFARRQEQICLHRMLLGVQVVVAARQRRTAIRACRAR